MLNNARFLLAAFAVSSLLVACGDNDATSTAPSAAPTATTTPASAPAPSVAHVTTVSATDIEAGTSEQAAADLLGEASFSQTRVIDELTFTYTEWANDKGTTSVQFHNGKAVYSQFVAAAEE